MRPVGVSTGDQILSIGAEAARADGRACMPRRNDGEIQGLLRDLLGEDAAVSFRNTHIHMRIGSGEGQERRRQNRTCESWHQPHVHIAGDCTGQRGDVVGEVVEVAQNAGGVLVEAPSNHGRHYTRR